MDEVNSSKKKSKFVTLIIKYYPKGKEAKGKAPKESEIILHNPTLKRGVLRGNPVRYVNGKFNYRLYEFVSYSLKDIKEAKPALIKAVLLPD